MWVTVYVWGGCVYVGDHVGVGSCICVGGCVERGSGKPGRPQVY